jgi:hypothetical protein
MKKKAPVTIRELDVQPISDEDLKVLAHGAQDEFISEYECCNDSQDETWRSCREA